MLHLNPMLAQQQNVNQVHNLQQFQFFLAQDTCFIASPELESVQSIKWTGKVVCYSRKRQCSQNYCNLLLWLRFCLIKNSLTWICLLCLALLLCASKLQVSLVFQWCQSNAYISFCFIFVLASSEAWQLSFKVTAEWHTNIQHVHSTFCYYFGHKDVKEILFRFSFYSLTLLKKPTALCLVARWLRKELKL